MKKRLLALLLACFMLISALPVVAFAEDENTTDEPTVDTDPTEHEHVITGYENYSEVFHKCVCDECDEEILREHEMQDFKPLQAPTCTTNGIAVAKCKYCDYTMTKDTGKLLHKYSDDVEWNWSEDKTSATVSISCQNEGHDEPEVVKATVTSKTTDADCETDGKTVYTATAIFSGKTYTDTKTVVIDALGHEYVLTESTGWTWTETDDGYTATAEFVCENDEKHTKIKDATVTASDDTATCTEAGKIVYTATVEFEGKTYTVTKEVETEALGHDYQYKAHDEATCKPGTEKVTCTRCDYEKIQENAEKYPAVGAHQSIIKPGYEYLKDAKYCGKIVIPHICSICETPMESETIENGENADHDFELLINAPTCVEEGEVRRTCKNCGLVETEKLDKAGHLWISDETFGNIVNHVCGCVDIPQTCGRCQETRRYSTMGKLPHDVEDKGEGEDGVHTYECKACHKTLVGSPEDPDKMVNEKVLGIKVMLIDRPTGKVDEKGNPVTAPALVFVSSVDTLDYKAAGFEITINGVTRDCSVTAVYEAIGDLKPADISQDSRYLTTYTINGLTEKDMDMEVTVRAYVTFYDETTDGYTVYSAEMTVAVGSLVNA